MKNLIALLLTISAIGLFYVYISPTYAEIKALRVEKAEYDEALSNSQKVQDARDELLEKYNSFAPSDLKRLEKLLPSHVDNIRLIIEVDGIASRYNMILKNVEVSSDAADSGSSDPNNQAFQSGTVPYGTAQLSFEVSGSYETYRGFMKDLQESLRIIDITAISFESGDSDKNMSGVYDFETSVKTYWLK